ncbi:hypothetical protein HWB62_gp05 [Clostridium phage CPS2]|uniref:Uncharacterized protein n=1 Tax=Clostridium phage CPS2 TaxID=2175605 RepID=A0A343X836_9CAUD|nr:hypothetical protein HWB62_gp05 [Clostridium phage CPS2]AWG96512.1 hypothetical protein CPS2_5 [Clostridium phage CPS2]
MQYVNMSLYIGGGIIKNNAQSDRQGWNPSVCGSWVGTLRC